MHKPLSALALAALVACGDTTPSTPTDDTGATASAAPGLTVGFRAGPRAARRAATGGTLTSAVVTTPTPSLQVTDGVHILVYDSVELVIAELELERTEATEDCATVTTTSDDSCEKIDAGPLLVNLPVDGTVSSIVTAQLELGEYDEIEFEIDRPNSDDPSFVAANPDFEDISVRVRGTFDGAPYEFASRVQAEQEIELAEPLVIDPAGAYGLTLSVDLAGWFLSSGGGTLLDPADLSGNDEQDVGDNIENSFDAYGDDDADGVPNGSDDDDR